MRRLFIITAISAVLLIGASAETKTPGNSRIDSKISEHYGVALNAYRKSDYSKVLAETSLILLDAPVRIYIDMTGVKPERYESYRNALTKGIESWNNALPGDMVFAEVDSPKKAQVTVKFEDTLKEEAHHICGHVYWRRKLNWDSVKREYQALLSADVNIALYESPNSRRWHDEASIQHIITHELGHVLGMEDSPNKGDIMGPDVHGKPCPKFAKEELAAIKELRAQCLKLRGYALAKMKRWDAAQVAYRNALAIVPDDEETLSQLNRAQKKLSPVEGE